MDRIVGEWVLTAYADLYCWVQLKFFSDVVAGRSPLTLKEEQLRRHWMPARMFNSLRVSLKRKVPSVQAQQLPRRGNLLRRISRGQGHIAKAG